MLADKCVCVIGFDDGHNKCADCHYTCGTCATVSNVTCTGCLPDSHRTFIEKQGIQQQKMDERYKRRITELITDDYVEKFWNDINCYELQKELKKNHHDRTSPYNFAKQMLEK